MGHVPSLTRCDEHQEDYRSLDYVSHLYAEKKTKGLVALQLVRFS